ncbi:hypothetical protein SO802_002373 [Lithocarpus litseifolius]|uniref:Uncharacterized protein n=1 Tax=Lithocarpus litseifolius TaxID=425828 RepID=A0AAW2DYQ7_9ROSI
MAPNNDEEREIDAAFLLTGVHVNVEADSGNDVEELPTPVEGQSSRRVEKWSAKSVHLGGKKKKGDSISEMTKAIKGFTEVSRARLNRSIDSMPQSRESFEGGDRFSIDKAVVVVNSYTDVDHFTYCKVLKELHNPETKAAFFSMMTDRRKAWMDFVGSVL